jgi:5'-nucleotidase
MAAGAVVGDPMRIIISNDDGIYSPGLSVLASEASRFGEVRIVAPDVEQSAMSHAITHSRPLTARRTRIGDFEAWRVNGTPADCVTLGKSQWSNVNVVLSGINLGPNLGNQMWHSGTLAAAKQAALLGLQGIALSTPMVGVEPSSYDPIRPYIARVLELLLRSPGLPLVNVNFPGRPRGLQWTRQSVRHYDGQVMLAKDPMGREHSWIVAVPIEETEEGTDRWAVDHGYVSVTPLRLDLTDHEALVAARERHPFE